MLPLTTDPCEDLGVGRVRTSGLYVLLGTDLTGKLSEHIYAPDLGLNVPS